MYVLDLDFLNVTPRFCNVVITALSGLEQFSRHMLASPALPT
jgi:hypothetical protein